MIEKRFIFGDRILGVKFSDNAADVIYESFLDILDNYSQELQDLMDLHLIPEELLVNFRAGKGDLLGFYYVNDDIVSKAVAIIDIYTKPLSRMGRVKLYRELLDTFAHEIIHHSVRNEKKTRKLVKEFLRNLGL